MPMLTTLPTSSKQVLPRRGGNKLQQITRLEIMKQCDERNVELLICGSKELLRQRRYSQAQAASPDYLWVRMETSHPV